MVPSARFLGAITLLTLSSTLARAAELKLAKNYVGKDFENDFTFYTEDDPTGGYVNYVTKAIAKAQGMITTSASYFKMGVDTSTSGLTSRGRNSVRIVSKDDFADGVYILDIDHMPVGCGTWPAWWTTTRDDWPIGGEIDIIEGANAWPATGSVAYTSTFDSAGANLTGVSQTSSDLASLHTISTCSIEDKGLSTGVWESTVCDATQNDNQGCGVSLGNGTWGSQWNSNAGGYYVMRRDFQNSGLIYIWSFPRNSADTPADIIDSTATTISPSEWTVQPSANFTIPQCKKNTFGTHAIVLNIALCGSWAGGTFTGNGCPGTCSDFVKNTPGAFADAYFGIRSMRIFTESGHPVGVSSMRTWVLVVIILGSLLGAGLISALLVLLCLRQRRSRNKNSTATLHSETSTASLNTRHPATSYPLNESLSVPHPRSPLKYFRATHPAAVAAATSGGAETTEVRKPGGLMPGETPAVPSMLAYNAVGGHTTYGTGVDEAIDSKTRRNSLEF
ncbi:Glycoside hydrolase, family 16 [Phaffia rhodozyma]|uniref:Glycoside hydrolase, family 16 n=1 Tax=Phaffia rhodozyma TaxID=264483 RepID=A0A0F7SMM3_PHARH|nr:Glycoside hydrolase, family 16 [Phaffia rhodozyma]